MWLFIFAISHRWDSQISLTQLLINDLNEKEVLRVTMIIVATFYPCHQEIVDQLFPLFFRMLEPLSLCLSPLITKQLLYLKTSVFRQEEGGWPKPESRCTNSVCPLLKAFLEAPPRNYAYICVADRMGSPVLYLKLKEILRVTFSVYVCLHRSSVEFN